MKLSCRLLLMLLIVCCAPMAALASPESQAISMAWANRTESLQHIVDEANSLQQNARQKAQELAANLQKTQTEIARFLNLYQASRNYPTERIVLLQQMQGLQRQLGHSMLPLDDMAAQVTARLEEIKQLKQDMDDFGQLDFQDSDGLSAEEVAQQTAYEKQLGQAEKQLGLIAARLDKFLSPIKTTFQRLSNTVSEIEKNLNNGDYYLHSAWDSSYSAGAFEAWASSLPGRLLLAYPQNADDWLYAGQRFILNVFIMALIGALAWRAARRLPARWRGPVYQILTRAWVWIALGRGLLAASSNQLGGMFFIFVILGVLLLVWGIASLSWRLRIAPSPLNQPSPMARLFIPAAIGVVLLYSDLPPKALLVCWGLVMLGFIVWLRTAGQKLTKGRALLQRMSYGSSFYFAVISLLVAVGGYARLAILLYMLLFALVNTVTLGSGLTRLSVIIVNRILSKEKRPVLNAIVQALATPAAWLVSLLCTLPWIWAVPGAIYLLQGFMEVDYTIGDASFDFSRVLLIVVLFFLFRSFVGLSKTSLTHLPDRLPHLERGVIPPLVSLASYVIWLVFALIVLGIVGVDFTSLAVVAGGLSVGIGLGMQSLFNNLVSGLILIFGKTVLVGDYVEVGGVAGTVRAVNMRSILIETPERAEVFVPTSSIMGGQLTNWTRNHRMVRRTITVGVAYGSDVTFVLKLLLDIAGGHTHVLKEPAPIAQFAAFGDSTLDFNLLVYIDDFSNSGSTTSALRVEIERVFRENNIEIAFPQLDVHLINDSQKELENR